jgi:hypothetical protein
MPFVDGRTIPEVLMRPGIHGRFLAHKDLGASTVSLLMNRCRDVLSEAAGVRNSIVVGLAMTSTEERPSIARRLGRPVSLRDGADPFRIGKLQVAR